MKHHRHNDGQQQHQKNETVSKGCESNVMFIHHCENGSLKARCNYVGYKQSIYLEWANLARQNTSLGFINVGPTKNYGIADGVAATTKFLCGDGQS
jgi:hypothetical protein